MPRTDLWTENEISTLKSKWGKLTCFELERLIPGRRWQAIQKKAQKLSLKGDMGLSSRKYSFDRFFFNKLNSINCYIAGFIAADGCVFERDNLVKICLSYKDISVLEYIKAETKFNGPIRKYNIQNKNYCDLSVYGAIEWIEDLKRNFNIIPNKSLILKSPNLKFKKHIIPYIIGMFDGDGSSFYSGNYYNFSFCGTFEMMRWIENEIKKITHITSNITKHSIANCYYLKYKNMYAFYIRKKLLDFNIPFRLHRKWFNVKNEAY